MSADLDLLVDRTSEVPVGTQLAWKLRTLIATGRLTPATQLPGIRELAELAGVNINTVRSVLARLEDQGLLVTQQGRGNFVADGARSHATLARTAELAIEQAVAAGIDPRELAAALYIAPPTAPRIAVPQGERTERQGLRGEIERLERELSELEPIGRLEPKPETAEPRLLTAAELRSIRDKLRSRIDALHHERHQWRLESERAAAAAEKKGLEPASERSWGAGVWTGGSAAVVSWTMS
jgi:DNA-binding transcriptional regulator YhcF (GntR family)